MTSSSCYSPPTSAACLYAVPIPQLAPAPNREGGCREEGAPAPSSLHQSTNPRTLPATKPTGGQHQCRPRHNLTTKLPPCLHRSILAATLSLSLSLSLSRSLLPASSLTRATATDGNIPSRRNDGVKRAHLPHTCSPAARTASCKIGSLWYAKVVFVGEVVPPDHEETFRPIFNVARYPWSMASN